MNSSVETRLIRAISGNYGADSPIVRVKRSPVMGQYLVQTEDGGVYLIGGSKVCTTCGEQKPFEEFHISNRAKDGMMNKCVDCEKAYYRQNKARYDEYHANYRAEHAERRAENNRKYRENNPTAIKVGYRNRRARKAAAPGKVTTDDIKAIRASQTDKKGRLICWRCGKPITDTPHLDHWIPLKYGGRNDAGNLHYMHDICNLSKGAKLPHEIGRLV